MLNGIDLEFRYKFIEDDDDRVKREEFLPLAYDSYSEAPVNPDWVYDFDSQFAGCTGCDDREAEYAQYGLAVGYQLHPDLYAKVSFDRFDVDLVDGTIDTAPVGLGFEGSPGFGYIEYLTGEHQKDRLAVQLNYFLSGVEFGADIEWFWGDYDPEFYINNNGVRARLIPDPASNAIITPLGNISTNDYDYEQYRLKAFMKVSF